MARGRRSGESDGEEERTGSPSSFPLVNHVPSPSTYIFYRSVRPFAVRRSVSVPFGSLCLRISLQVSLPSPGRSVLKRSVGSLSFLSAFLSLSLPHLVSPLSAAMSASRSLTSRRFRAGPALRRPSLYSLFEDNRSDLTPLFFLIPPFFLIEPRRASSSAARVPIDSDERPRGRAPLRGPSSCSRACSLRCLRTPFASSAIPSTPFRTPAI